MPWLVSLGVHLVLVLTVGILLSAPCASRWHRRWTSRSWVPPGAGRGAPAAALAPSARAVVPRPPRPETLPARACLAAGPDPAPPGESCPSPRSLPMPSARDVLADAAAAAQRRHGCRPSLPRRRRALPSGPDVAWEGLARKLIRRHVPGVPDVPQRHGPGGRDRGEDLGGAVRDRDAAWKSPVVPAILKSMPAWRRRFATTSFPEWRAEPRR